MSYPLQGVNFDEQPFTPSDDCALWSRCVSDGILHGMAISAAGSGLTVSAGWLMCGGKQLHLPAAITVPITEALSGLARLVVTVDLSKTSKEDVFAQAQIDLEYESAFGSLIRQDLAGSGSVYQMVLCTVSLGSAGITGIVSTCGLAHGKGAGVSVLLPASGWANNAQTVFVAGATPDGCIVATYDPASRDVYQTSGIYLAAQGDNTLVFACDDTPLEDVTANVLLM